MSDEERRGSARVHVRADVEVHGPRRRVFAVLKELARDSARLSIAELPAAAGEMLEIFLPGPRGTIEVMTEVLRVNGAAPDFDVVVTFAVVEPTQRRDLDMLLKLLLAGDGGGQRAAPRIARRLEVRWGDLGERTAILVDLSRGGLGMLVGVPLKREEHVVVRVPTARGDLVLAGTVANVRQVATLTWQAGVQLTGVDEVTRRQLDRFLEQLVGAGDP